MKRLIPIVALALFACAPQATNSSQQPTYQVLKDRMENNFVPFDGGSLEVNFYRGTISGFTVVYQGPNFRFLDGPATLTIDGKSYSVSGSSSNRSTRPDGTVLEVNAYSFFADVKQALQKANNIHLTLGGSTPIKTEFTPENISRVKAFF